MKPTIAPARTRLAGFYFFGKRFLSGDLIMRILFSAAMTALLAVPALVSAAEMTSTKDIVSTAESAGQFTTLVTALKAAGLVSTLQGTGPFTVFAPTDAAFAKLPAGTVESLLKPANKKKLVAILTYHVISGNVKAAEVTTMTTAKTVNGQSVAISVNGSTVKINDATVVKADVAASNGTIHVIDTVLMPK